MPERDPRDVVCEAASDLMLAKHDPEFAKLNGGYRKLLDTLEAATYNWHRWMNERNDAETVT